MPGFTGLENNEQNEHSVKLTYSHCNLKNIWLLKNTKEDVQQNDQADLFH